MPLYLPAAERVEIIRTYARAFETKVFIETGTSVGDTVAALLDDFDVLNTIELDRDLYYRAKDRFSGIEKVNCYCGDSGDYLAGLVAYFSTPVLFWLDGHWSGGPVRGEIDTPIVSELSVAVTAPKGSVILIDDARLFGGGPEHTEEFKDYPPLSWVRTFAQDNGFHYKLEDDIIRLVPV